MYSTLHAWIGRVARPFARAGDNAMAHERARFYTLLSIALLKLFNLFGAIWDIQWHASIGRDSFWIPPHMVAALGYVAASCLALAAMTYETWLDQRGVPLQGVMRRGGITTSPYFLIVALAYLSGYFFTFLDDQWHQIFGLDATLWSPPHLLLGLAMASVDFGLLLGLTVSARRLGYRITPFNAYFWGFLLLGAFMFESANYWTSQAFIYSYSQGGAGLLGLLFPIMIGMLYPLALVLNVRLAKAYWIVVPILALTLILQYVGTGLAALGFAILQPVSVMDEYLRQNPQATIALAHQFADANGMPGLIGLLQAWVMWLSAGSLGLVALLSLVPGARGRWLLAAPVYSISLVLICYLWFQRLPVMAHYQVTLVDVALAVLLTAAGGLALGWLGSRLAAATEGQAA